VIVSASPPRGKPSLNSRGCHRRRRGACRRRRNAATRNSGSRARIRRRNRISAAGVLAGVAPKREAGEEGAARDSGETAVQNGRQCLQVCEGGAAMERTGLRWRTEDIGNRRGPVSSHCAISASPTARSCRRRGSSTRPMARLAPDGRNAVLITPWLYQRPSRRRAQPSKRQSAGLVGRADRPGQGDRHR